MPLLLLLAVTSAAMCRRCARPRRSAAQWIRLPSWGPGPSGQQGPAQEVAHLWAARRAISRGTTGPLLCCCNITRFELRWPGAIWGPLSARCGATSCHPYKRAGLPMQGASLLERPFRPPVCAAVGAWPAIASLMALPDWCAEAPAEAAPHWRVPGWICSSACLKRSRCVSRMNHMGRLPEPGFGVVG